MNLPDDVDRVGTAAQRLRDAREMYEQALSRYDAIPKTDAAKEDAVPMLIEQQGYDDAEEAAAALEANHEQMYETIVARAEEVASEIKNAYDAALTVKEKGRLDSAAEQARFSTTYDNVDSSAAVEQIVEDVKKLAEIDAETTPQIGVNTGAINLVDDVSVPHPDTARGKTARADRRYLDMTEAEQGAELDRLIAADQEHENADGLDPGGTLQA